MDGVGILWVEIAVDAGNLQGEEGKEGLVIHGIICEQKDRVAFG